MEDNFKHRQDLVKPDDKLYNTNREYASEDERPIQHSGIGPRAKDGKDLFPIKSTPQNFANVDPAHYTTVMGCPYLDILFAKEMLDGSLN